MFNSLCLSMQFFLPGPYSLSVYHMFMFAFWVAAMIKMAIEFGNRYQIENDRWVQFNRAGWRYRSEWTFDSLHIACVLMLLLFEMVEHWTLFTLQLTIPSSHNVFPMPHCIARIVRIRCLYIFALLCTMFNDHTITSLLFPFQVEHFSTNLNNFSHSRYDYNNKPMQNDQRWFSVSSPSTSLVHIAFVKFEHTQNIFKILWFRCLPHLHVYIIPIQWTSEQAHSS